MQLSHQLLLLLLDVLLTCKWKWKNFTSHTKYAYRVKFKESPKGKDLKWLLEAGDPLNTGSFALHWVQGIQKRWLLKAGDPLI